MWGEREFSESMRSEFPGRGCEYKKNKSRFTDIGVEYLKKAGVWDWLVGVDEESKSSGTNPYNLAVLWEYIKTYKPQYFLELGTGVSTHLIARAMDRFCKYDEIKLVSMEHNEKYYEWALQQKPKFNFVEILLSEIALENIFSWVVASYVETPWYPYDMVFVDGPPQDTFAGGDLFWVIANSKKDITAVIDQRVLTVLAYYFLLGKNHIKNVGGSTYVVHSVNSKTLDYRNLAADHWKRAEIFDRIGYMVDDTLDTDILIGDNNEASS